MEKRSNTFRLLENYKKQHEETAKSKNVYDRFMSARTLTRARGILFGFKSKYAIRDK